MGRWQDTLDSVQKLARGKDIEQFRIDAADFLSARERGEGWGIPRDPPAPRKTVFPLRALREPLRLPWDYPEAYAAVGRAGP